MQIIVRFLKPVSLAGHISAWRTTSEFSHAVLVFDNVAFNATHPRIVSQHVTNPKVSLEHRGGLDVSVRVSHTNYVRMMKWCCEQLGKPYDHALLAWLFKSKRFLNADSYYCFEFCRKPFEMVGLLDQRDDIVTGENLLLDLIRVNYPELNGDRIHFDFSK